MFGIYLQSFDVAETFDLIKGPQIFDYKHLKLQYKAGKIAKFVKTSLIPCTREHWKNMPTILSQFEQLQVDKWLCPILNSGISVQAFMSSQNFKLAIIDILPCVNTTENGNKCAPQTIIDATMAKYKNFYLRTVFSNPVINPNEVDYLKYYLQQRNSIIISQNSGVAIEIEFSDY